MTTFPAFLEHLVKDCPKPKHSRRWLGDVPCPECVGRRDLTTNAEEVVQGMVVGESRGLSANTSVGMRNAQSRLLHGLRALLESYPESRQHLSDTTGIAHSTTYDHARCKHRADPAQVRRYAQAFGVSEEEVYGEGT